MQDACQTILEKVYWEVKNQENYGKQASYIPELAAIDGEYFGASLLTTKLNHYQIGDSEVKFSIQSIAKVLSLSLALEAIGKSLWKRVGVEPSGDPFNSLVQLEYEAGIPRNPLINSGAIVICDILISHFGDAKQEFLNQLRKIAHNQAINYSEKVAESEKELGFRNQASINFMKSFGNINNDIEEVLDFYYHLCSIEMSCNELAQTFLFLANEGCDPINERQLIKKSNARRVNAIMMSCGFYDESGEFAYRVGLPGKSGVGGGIVAVHPDNYAIAVWSPKLNEKGNSYRALKFLEAFTSQTDDSIF